MGTLLRGAKNAFRNTVRTLSVTLILGISVGLALIMLLSYKTVQAKIASVKSSIGNTVTVTPAGAQGFQGGGEPLTETQMADIRSISHVTAVAETLADRLTPTTDTSLVSAIEPGTLGNRQRRFDRGDAPAGGGTAPGGGTQTRTFTIPIMVAGLSGTASLSTGTAKLTAGQAFDGSKDESVAVVGVQLATKNSLSVGSTFTAYGTTITVVGISDQGNQFANAGLSLPIKALQRLSDQANNVTSATVTVDEVGNLDSVVSAIKSKVGEDKADVVSNGDAAKEAIEPLENIRRISLSGLIGALAAGAVITLLIMVMIVRERRREIGVLKAIGASNFTVMAQFVSESLVLTLLGGLAGIIGGVLFSNPVLGALVKNGAQASPAASPVGTVGGRAFGRVAQFGGQVGGGIQSSIRDLHASVGPEIILYGLLAAIAIAIIGSAIPAWLIAKVKPAEVMRGE